VNLPDVFTRYRGYIDSGLKSTVGEAALPLFGMLRYHMGWADEKGQPMTSNSGKAVRPALCLFSCEAVGGSKDHALPAALGLELVHNFSLIHDDIQDGDTERRHRATVWYLWGIDHGINAGAALNVVANLALFPKPLPSTDGVRLLAASRLLTQSCAEMIEGQAIDLSFEERLNVTVNDYLVMVGKKTGALLTCAVHMGALLGTDCEDTIAQLRLSGKALGALFQIRDDILGVWGKEAETGKPVAADIKRRKKSLPAVHALERASGQAHDRLRDIYRRRDSMTQAELDDVLDIMDDCSTQRFCQDLAAEKAQAVTKELSKVKMEPWARQGFEELATFLLEREF